MDASVSDIELINKCLSGEHDAFSELVSRYKRLIFKVDSSAKSLNKI